MTVDNRTKSFLSRMESRINGPYIPTGSLSRTQISLIMSHDNNKATLMLEKGKLDLRFLGVRTTTHFKELNEVLASTTSKISRTLINSPFYPPGGREEIIVHPIGGAIMSKMELGRRYQPYRQALQWGRVRGP